MYILIARQFFNWVTFPWVSRLPKNKLNEKDYSTSPHNLPLFLALTKTSYGDLLWFQEIFWKIRKRKKVCRVLFSFSYKKNSSFSPLYFLLLPISPSFFLLSPFCVQKCQKSIFSTPKSLENQLEWLQFSEIIRGPNNLAHHPITCSFFGTENKL